MKGKMQLIKPEVRIFDSRPELTNEKNDLISNNPELYQAFIHEFKNVFSLKFFANLVEWSISSR